MSKKTLSKFITLLLVTVLAVLGLGKIIVEAVDSDGPLTDVIITKVETKDEAKKMTIEQLAGGVDVGTYFTEAKPLEGVTFTYYEVTDDQLVTLKANPADYDTVAKITAKGGFAVLVVTGDTNSAGQVTIPNLLKGNYWIVENTKRMSASSTAVPFGLTLPFANPEGTDQLREIYVYPKNVFQDIPVVYSIDRFVNEKKEDNVTIGENNVWRISVPLPEKIEDYAKFGVIDEIDSRLNIEAIDNVFAVADNGNELIKSTDYTVEVDKTAGQIGTGPIEGKSLAGKVTVEFTKSGLIKLKDSEEVNISIDRQVNDTAIMGQKISNNVVLNFDNGNGSNDTQIEPISPEVEPFVSTGGKGFIKQDENNSEKLVGAEFIIKNATGKYVKVGSKGAITFVNKADATAFK
jgi:fimbrial isopeptide formation D2 family protein